jgi:hypothetical protein
MRGISDLLDIAIPIRRFAAQKAEQVNVRRFVHVGYNPVNLIV